VKSGLESVTEEYEKVIPGKGRMSLDTGTSKKLSECTRHMFTLNLQTKDERVKWIDIEDESQKKQEVKKRTKTKNKKGETTGEFDPLIVWNLPVQERFWILLKKLLTPKVK